MPAAARKSADAAPAAAAADAEKPEAAPESAPAEAPGPEAPLADQAPAPAEAPVAEFRPAQTLVFLGQAASFVSGVGLCEPGGSYPMAAAVADRLCAGRRPLFARPAAS